MLNFVFCFLHGAGGAGGHLRITCPLPCQPSGRGIFEGWKVEAGVPVPGQPGKAN